MSLSLRTSSPPPPSLHLSLQVTGIIIQLPLPAHLDAKECQQAVDTTKDVEGMHPTMYPTAKAAVELLRQTGLELQGLETVVVGHSEIVGRPIAHLLLDAGCTVTTCHQHTRNLHMFTRHADAVLVAVGKPGLIDGSMIKPGAAVIDVGINQLENGTVVGDVDFKDTHAVAGWITPVPGGVGTVTTAVRRARVGMARGC